MKKKKREERRRGQCVTKASLWDETECRVDLSPKAECPRKEREGVFVNQIPRNSKHPRIPKISEKKEQCQVQSWDETPASKVCRISWGEGFVCQTLTSNLRFISGISGVMMGIYFVFFVILQLLMSISWVLIQYVLFLFEMKVIHVNI